jgi:hypothetical protein
MNTVSTQFIGGAVIAAVLAGFAFFSTASASPMLVNQASAGYGNGNERVTVCRATKSRFLPYVTVTVPESVVDRWIADGRAILPDSEGECPKAEVTIQDYIKDKISAAMNRLRG